jgi:preprotein translocase subunit SecA
LNAQEAQIVEGAGKPIGNIATNMAGRGTDIKLSAEVKAGGLAIVGTDVTIHVVLTASYGTCRTSRRCSSQFYVSLRRQPNAFISKRLK